MTTCSDVAVMVSMQAHWHCWAFSSGCDASNIASICRPCCARAASSQRPKNSLGSPPATALQQKISKQAWMKKDGEYGCSQHTTGILPASCCSCRCCLESVCFRHLTRAFIPFLQSGGTCLTYVVHLLSCSVESDAWQPSGLRKGWEVSHCLSTPLIAAGENEDRVQFGKLGIW